MHNANLTYRGLAEGEDVTKGLTARAPGTETPIASHVAGKRQSQWISTTLDEGVARKQFGKNGVVEIDMSKVKSEVVDISKGIPGITPA